ncbi:MAG: hypothetical protein ACOYJX_03170 [Acutalibacteraceae bacterium]|jgi:hypothetical protein
MANVKLPHLKANVDLSELLIQFFAYLDFDDDNDNDDDDDDNDDYGWGDLREDAPESAKIAYQKYLEEKKRLAKLGIRA